LTFSVMFWMVRFFKTGAEWAPELLEEAMVWSCESKGEMVRLHEQKPGWLAITEQRVSSALSYKDSDVKARYVGQEGQHGATTARRDTP
jgi:hypothetical protein